MIAPVCRLLFRAGKRGLAGFVAGFIVACFALVILGAMPLHGDLGPLEVERHNRGLSIAFFIACGTALVSALAGGLRVSEYWLWFCVTFGVICLIPYWPHKSGTLPLGTVYVNGAFWAEYRIPCLAVHTVVSLALAAISHQASRILRAPKKG